MAEVAPSPLEAFTVRRGKPEAVAPAKPTPREVKQLSGIDQQGDVHYHMPILQFYKRDPLMQGRDPAKVIRDALAQTLVFYYPFAGRIRQLPSGELAVDCTGEGAMFVEAEADVALEQFGHPIHPPFPCSEKILYDLPGSYKLLNCPLLLMQVTRLKCGGFIVCINFSHTMCDAAGLFQFLNAVSEMARGANSPPIQPQWQRELLMPRNPPLITCPHNEFAEADDDETVTAEFPVDMLDQRCFLFGPEELLAIRRLAPPHLQSCTKFEILAACLWQCCAVALRVDPNEKVRIRFPVNARSKFNPPLPAGYYGNVIATPVAVTSAGELRQNPVGYGIELVRHAKTMVNEEYLRSLVDLNLTKGRLPSVQAYYVSDLTHIGLDKVDYGWGEAVYAGPQGAWADEDTFCVESYLLPYNDGNMNKTGMDGIMMLVSLPGPPAMQRFTAALQGILKNGTLPGVNTETELVIQ